MRKSMSYQRKKLRYKRDIFIFYRLQALRFAIRTRRQAGSSSHVDLHEAKVGDLRMNVVSLQRIIGILPVDVRLCIFTLTATAPDPDRSSVAVRNAHRPHQPMEGMER
jgi:hypothetical protein